MTLLTQQALQAASKLPPLLIETIRVAQAVQQGVHGRRRVGIGDSFWQYRHYEGGDPLHIIDWKQSARSEKLYVRQREWEAAQTVYLWVDRSGSMQYRSRPDLPTKTERGHVMLLALAHLLLYGGEFVNWLSNTAFDARGQAGFDKIVGRVLPIQEHSADLPPDLKIARHSYMILCSDFLIDNKLWRDRLRRYADRNVTGILLHLTDPEEENPSFKGRVRLEGMEQEPSLLIPNAEAIRATYLQNLALHKYRLGKLAEGFRWHAISHVTGDDPAIALLQLYNLLTLGERTP